MPENAYRKGHLVSHLAASSRDENTVTLRQLGERADADAMRRAHLDWPVCAAGCGWPLAPAAADGGHDRHPTCEAT